MSKKPVSFIEANQAQLDYLPYVPGRIILCTDTGNMYYDIGNNNRSAVGRDIAIVDELPIAPITGRIYLVKPSSLYIYLEGEWHSLNPIAELRGSITSLSNRLDTLDNGFEDRVDAKVEQIFDYIYETNYVDSLFE